MTIADKIRLAEMWAAAVDPPVILTERQVINSRKSLCDTIKAWQFDNLPNWLSEKSMVTLTFHESKDEAWLALWDQLRVIILPMKFLLADIVGLEVKQQVRMAFIHQIGEK